MLAFDMQKLRVLQEGNYLCSERGDYMALRIGNGFMVTHSYYEESTNTYAESSVFIPRI